MPAVVVEGNLEVKGNPTVTGPAGSIHANGTLELSGNPCTHVYYASVGGTTESGNVQGGTGCTAADVDARPFSPRLNIPKLDPFTVARQAQAAGVAVKTLIGKNAVAPDGVVYCTINAGCAYNGLPGGPAGSGIASTLVALGTIPTGWDHQPNPHRTGAPRARPRPARTSLSATRRSRPTPAVLAAPPLAPRRRCHCWRWARLQPTEIRRSFRMPRSRSSVRS